MAGPKLCITITQCTQSLIPGRYLSSALFCNIVAVGGASEMFLAAPSEKKIWMAMANLVWNLHIPLNVSYHSRANIINKNIWYWYIKFIHTSPSQSHLLVLRYH